MLDTILPAAFARLDLLEVRVCRPANAAARHPVIRRYFATVSRLGDGVAWYLLLAVLPFVFGRVALTVTVQAALTALVGTAIYRVLKARLVRERPFHAHVGLRAHVRPLDRYSFPSGHTLHAVCFTVMTGTAFPELLWITIPFAASVGLSRVVLGLHYPSDVVAGGLIGFALARLSLVLS